MNKIVSRQRALELHVNCLTQLLEPDPEKRFHIIKNAAKHMLGII